MAHRDLFEPFEVLGKVPGNPVLVADDPDAFADAIARLYRDEVLWNRLSHAGIANVRQHFSPQAAAEPIGRVFELARRKRSAAA